MISSTDYPIRSQSKNIVFGQNYRINVAKDQAPTVLSDLERILSGLKIPYLSTEKLSLNKKIDPKIVNVFSNPQANAIDVFVKEDFATVPTTAITPENSGDIFKFCKSLKPLF